MMAWRIARRELRGGLAGFRVFLVCLALGVAAIAAVGLVRDGIARGLQSNGAVLLGGDAQLSFTYRAASDEERAWMADQALRVSEVFDFRSMLVVQRDGKTERALTKVKAVDDLYPLKGALQMTPSQPLGQDGIALAQVLADRLGLQIGDQVRLGAKDFILRAVLGPLPDDAGSGFSLGPPTLVKRSALEGAQLLQPGTLYNSHYRLELPEVVDLSALEAEAQERFRDTGMRWRDSRNAAPGLSEFIERMGAFLVLVGLAGLAVGGVGVSAAVRAYLDGKTEVIATLKTLGAESRVIFAAYLIQIGILAALGIAMGLVLGALIPLALAPLIEARLPLPAQLGLQPGPLLEAALYGALSALIFTLLPLSRSGRVRAAALFRDMVEPMQAWPGWRVLVVLSALAAALVAAAAGLSGQVQLTFWAAVGILGALLLLVIVAWGLRLLARRAAGMRVIRGRSVLRLALGAIGGPGGEATSVVLSLGLGLTVLAAVGQIDANLRAAISDDLPAVAPSYFVVDIQPDQLDGFLARLQNDPAVNRVETAPMLRGVITRINGEPAREVAGAHWVLDSDRGVTSSASAPSNTEITAGAWWPEDYTGPPQISFAAEEAEELGLQLGDMLTVNILGRDIEARISSFRVVDFSTAGIGFVLSMNPAALAGAPYTSIATIYAEEQAEAAILRDLAELYPNITAIRMRDAIERVSGVLRTMVAAITYGALATLVTGVFVLIGAAAAGQRARIYEAAVLKTLGAARGQVLAYFALRATLLGAAAGAVAVFAGGVAGWAVLTFVMDADYSFEPGSALIIVSGGVLATLLSSLGFAWRPLSARPARVLRARE